MNRCPCYAQPADAHPLHFIREITEESPTLGYSRNRLKWDPLHWGQLKLLISEIEFLTPFYGQSYHVVYAGAAPGIHMPILANLFSSMHFILVDPAPSMIKTGEYSNITVLQAYMTNAQAQHFKDEYQKQILLVSDIRIGADDVNENQAAMQARIHRDMEMQREWIKIMQPESSILKFRLPWDLGNGHTEYPGGTMLLPVYGKKLTHEARLVVDRGARDVAYDNRLYEGQMAYFNRILRTGMYSAKECINQYLQLSKPASPQKVTKCYDCTSFLVIVGAYLLKCRAYTKSNISYEAIEAECIRMEESLKALIHHWENIRGVHMCL